MIEEREGEGGSDGKERECVCLCVCVCERERESELNVHYYSQRFLSFFLVSKRIHTLFHVDIFLKPIR